MIRIGFSSPVLALAILVPLVGACSSDDASSASSTNSGGAGGANGGSSGSGGARDGGAGSPSLGTPHAEVVVEGAEIKGANGMFFDRNDRLYVASVNSRRLFVIDPDTGETLETIGAEKGVMSPDDVTIGPDGTVYFTNIAHGTVGAIAPNGAAVEIAASLQGANSITMSDDGRLFVGRDFLSDGLYELDPTGVTAPRQVIAEPGWINAMDFGPDGFIYGPQWSQARVVRIDPDSGAMTVVASGFDSLAAAVKFDSTGQLHTLEHVPAHVDRLDVQTGARTILATYPCNGDNLAFDSSDRLFFSCGSDGSVHEMTSDGSLRAVKPGGLVAPSGIVVEERDGVERVTVMNIGLTTYDGVTGAEIERLALPSYFGELRTTSGGSAIRVDGDHLLVADWTPGHGVEVWDLAAGTVVESHTAAFAHDVIRFQGDLVVSQHLAGNVAVLGAGDPTLLVENIGLPTGLAATDDDLFVASHGTGEILLIVEDGSVVAPPRVVASGIAEPDGLAILPNGNLVVVETGTGNVIAVDVASGDRTILAEGISPSFTLLDGLPAWGINGIAVAPSGTVYVTSPGEGRVHAIRFQ